MKLGLRRFAPRGPLPRTGNLPKDHQKIRTMFSNLNKYAKTNPKFNMDFINSLAEQFEKYSSLSDLQKASLARIHRSFIK
jgi:hypothetical protein